MGFLARMNKLGDSLGRKTKSVPPVPPHKDTKEQQQDKPAPVVHIVKQSTSPTDYEKAPPVPRKTKSRPAPLTLPQATSSCTINLATQSDQPQPSTSTYRADSLVRSSLITPCTPSAMAARQISSQVETEAGIEELKSSPPSMLSKRTSVDPTGRRADSGVSTPSKGGGSRLFRRASEKIVDRDMSRQKSRTGDRYDDFLESIGRSLSSTTHMSMISLASNRSTTAPSKGSIELHQDRSPSMKTVWQRARHMSNASSREISPSLSSSASFPRTFSRDGSAQADDLLVDSPATSQSSGNFQQLSLFPASPSSENDDGVAVPQRWRKLSKKSLRPRQSNSVDCESIQLYMLRLSPPPRGLAADDMDGRTKLVCNYVQSRLSEEKKKMAKTAFMRPLTATSADPTSASSEQCVETLEDVIYQWMIEDSKQEPDTKQYSDLHLADVFIEARRSLGIDSKCERLHSMFDVGQKQVPHAVAVEARRDARAMEPQPTSPPPPSAWDNSLRKQTSLTPAPRRRRRPKTTPVNHSCSVDDLHQGSMPLSEKSPSSLNHSIGGPCDTRKTRNPVRQKTPSSENPSAVAFPSVHDHPVSLPPSPPKSIDSHHYAEVTPYPTDNTHPQHARILSEVLAL